MKEVRDTVNRQVWGQGKRNTALIIMKVGRADRACHEVTGEVARVLTPATRSPPPPPPPPHLVPVLSHPHAARLESAGSGGRHGACLYTRDGKPSRRNTDTGTYTRQGARPQGTLGPPPPMLLEQLHPSQCSAINRAPTQPLCCGPACSGTAQCHRRRATWPKRPQRREVGRGRVHAHLWCPIESPSWEIHRLQVLEYW